MRTFTTQQATQRVEKHIAVAALPVTPIVEEQSTTTGLPCDDPTDLGPRGRVIESKRYWMRDLPFDRADELFNAMHSYWLSHDYRVLSDQRHRPVPALFVESNADAFRMAMTTSVRDDFAISATLPCVWPDGTRRPRWWAANPTMRTLRFAVSRSGTPPHAGYGEGSVELLPGASESWHTVTSSRSGKIVIWNGIPAISKFCPSRRSSTSYDSPSARPASAAFVPSE